MADFAAAQERILARRQARAAAAQEVFGQQHQRRTNDLLALPPTLRVACAEGLRLWDALKSPFGTQPAFRVGQVDAELLDEELLSLLQTQAADGLKLFGPHLKEEWGAEIGASLRLILWKLSIWDHGASYGASLQGLKYVDARGSAEDAVTAWQKAMYGLFTVGGRYAWNKWEEKLSSLENGYDEPSSFVQRASRLTTTANTTHTVAAFASFLIFLYNGRYRTLTDRILRLRLVPSTNQTSREVSFEYLNRQLVWHAFTEFLLFLLPLVGISRWRRWLSRFWKRTKSTFTSLRTGKKVKGDDIEDDTKSGELSFLPERTCAICYEDQNPTSGSSEQTVLSATANGGVVGSASTDITNPYETVSCGCIYCFICLTSRIESEEGEGWVCLRCGESVHSCKPWNGDVYMTEHIERPPSRKSIAWADELVDERTEDRRSVDDDEGYGGEEDGDSYDMQ
nr:peroxisomal biogenesis factor 2 [Quercus suber]